MSSATGGPLLPVTLPNEVALRRFMQGLVVGITGLEDKLVRPRWQPDPPPMPANDINWLAFDIRERLRDANAYVEMVGDTQAKMLRHEEFTLACSFYGPQGPSYAEVLIDGLELAQNREPLFTAGMAYITSLPAVNVPEEHNNRWYARHDVSLRFRRELDKRYEILCFTGAIGAIITEILTLPFEVTNPSP